MAQTVTDVAPGAWRGLAALIRKRLDDGCFGAGYPEMCPDGEGPCGTHEKLFWDAALGEIPALGACGGGVLPYQEEPPAVPSLMDLIEFCWRAVGKVSRGRYHPYFQHHHLSFDEEAGREEFEEDVNRIFRRNGLAYRLTSSGAVERVLPAELDARLRGATFQTGDGLLDGMLDAARSKFLDPDEAVRREGLQKLWDAFERLKTLGGQSKKAGMAALLDEAAGAKGDQLRKTLETEAEALTRIGNTFHIRHSETSQEPLSKAAHVDYLFQRMFAFIWMLLQTTGKPG